MSTGDPPAPKKPVPRHAIRKMAPTLFVRIILSELFCPNYFVRIISSELFCTKAFCPNAFCPNAFCPNAFCTNYFVRMHFVGMHFVRMHFVRMHFVRIILSELFRLNAFCANDKFDAVFESVVAFKHKHACKQGCQMAYFHPKNWVHFGGP
jgi:hypothetical protein